jgi:nucleoside-diphosphate-sugar epimerase
MKKKWLITGGGGFLGGYLVDYLCKNNESVICHSYSKPIENSYVQDVHCDLSLSENGSKAITDK